MVIIIALIPKQILLFFWESECDYSEEAPEVVYKDLYSMIHEIFIDWVLEDYNYDGSNKENKE